MEKCFVMLKPGVINRRLVGEVIYSLSKNLKASTDILEVASDKEFIIFASPSLYLASTIKKIIDVKTVADGCVATVRRLCGPTKVEDQAPGTIRGDYCIHMGLNIVHASDSVESAEREIKLWFKSEELCDWPDKIGEDWI